mgnify:CR=1 FL=1
MTGSFVPHGDQASDVDRYDKLPSQAGSASDGSQDLAPLDAIWNLPVLREAYRSFALIALRQSLRGAPAASLAETLDTMKRLWAADHAFRPRASEAEEPRP